MAYPFLLIEILVVINQQDTPPFLPPHTPDLTLTPIKLDFLRFFNAFFVLYFPLQGLLFALDPAYWTQSKYTVDAGAPLLSVFLFPLIFYLLTLFGFYSAKKIRIGEFNLSVRRNDFPARSVSVVALLVFSGLVTSYISLYGGFDHALAMAKSLRAGYAERSDFAFIKRFFWLAPLAMTMIGARLILIGKTTFDSLFFLPLWLQRLSLQSY